MCWRWVFSIVAFVFSDSCVSVVALLEREVWKVYVGNGFSASCRFTEIGAWHDFFGICFSMYVVTKRP